MDEDILFPRLSRFLRAKTRLEPRKQVTNSSLPRVTQYEINRNSHNVNSSKAEWEDVYNIIRQCDCVTPDLVQKIQHFKKSVKTICDASYVGDETVLFVFKTFLEVPLAQISHCRSLAERYGINNQATYALCNLVNEIVNDLNDECIKRIRDHLTRYENGLTNGNLWGGPIPNELPVPWEAPDTSFLADLSQSKATILDSFSMAYNGEPAPDVQKKTNEKKPAYGKSWLLKELQKCNASKTGISAEEICESIVLLLTSSRTSDDLQNELFEFLGFDNFELIQLLLEHRQNIMMSIKLEEDKRFSKLDDFYSNKKPDIYSTIAQVTVKTAETKQQEKLARKEDKKLMKFAAREIDGSPSPPKELQPQFYVRRPSVPPPKPADDVISEKKKVYVKRETYPFVFDSVRQSQNTTGYIAGVKMMLPEDVKRTDNKQYEEVHMPIAPPSALPVGNTLVPISSLDKFGQLAFDGVKNLNRIQSVVFETAYKTNENLLICAPTGAGKTNVALLTVMHTIRQYIEHDVILKDQFKIVYVAPMKALAAEMTANFSKKLSCLGITVRELTGDMQLTKTEILKTQMLITTPEKWDVVTRKSTGDVALSRLVKLLIIDEVHLLHGDRGPVIEALVARTLRQVESSQSMIRIVGLSATLPNYLDVARFLRVNPQIGLFYFDGRFRPVPLEQTFIGVKGANKHQQMSDMDSVCYEKVVDLVQKGHQVMVFVHARNATVRTANVLLEMARNKGQMRIFQPEDGPAFGNAARSMGKARSRELGDLFNNGFSVHHAGLLRSDRSMVEKIFGQGLIKVLVCTSTLAWGVNLPAHAVVIRGTEIYDAKHGAFVDLGILDVLQIFGRAGRPQFDSSGHGIIITTHNKLSHYLSLLTNQFPIESSFINFLADNLNAEVSLGTISNVTEAVEWLSYTYLYVRMRINPLVYGLTQWDVEEDPLLGAKRRDLIVSAAKALDKAKMIRFNERTEDLSITDLGRTASHFYIKYDTVEVFNELLAPAMSEPEVLAMVSNAQEFQQLKVRDDEMDELDELLNNCCEFEVKGGKENLHGKVNILMQVYLSRQRVNSFSLMSDLSYITQNSVRIIRALFEVTLRSNNSLLAGRLLQMALMMEHQQWGWETPLRQFSNLSHEIIEKIEQRDLSVISLREMDSKEIGLLLRHSKMGPVVKKCAFEFPLVELDASVHPITRTVLRVKLLITPDFNWNDRVHGKSSEPYWVWIEDPTDTNIYHSEYFLLTRKQVIYKETQELVMTIPLVEPIPAQYLIKVTNDRWLGCSAVLGVSVQNLILPESHPPHTELLDLQPLSVKALKNKSYESLYKFSHYNPIQTQLFHCLYHTDHNALIGAPTGSGKTIMAEMAMFRVFSQYPGAKIVYVAPLKALVRERIEDWKIRFEQKLGKSVVELTGDVSPDVQAINSSDVIVTTPEKWDGISRSWQTRGYVQKVALIILDEVHLLGEDRGPVLEVIVSRTNFISAHTEKTLRIVALSTALANARDLANWLGIKHMGLYNFRPSVRPVPLEVHINGFPGKHYCPRMATMNKPVFQAIQQHSPSQPALVFVSSRRQTRLTALDLIAYLAAENNPKQWMHLSEENMDQIIGSIKDTNLRLTLAFGIGLHHAGLQERDRKTVEELFLNQKIQVLIATATLAWGVNLPAHLVVVKGTEYYDGKTKRYNDMPITDVLQMMGRAGRPQFDHQGVAVILVHDIKKNFYRKFLYEPFPVESNLLAVLPDHLSAEIVAGTIKTKQEALDYLTWTYFFRRLLKNPSYYGLESKDPADVNTFLSQLVDKSLLTLYYAGCISLDEDERSVSTTSMGRIAAYYYLSYQTMLQLNDNLQSTLSLEKCLFTMCHVYEYSQLPVRHNEEILNGDLAKRCPWPVDPLQLDSPHIKTYLLLQAHFSRLDLPCTDYYTDLKSVLDQATRILQGMLDVCAESGWLAVSIRLVNLMQMVMQGRWLSDSPLTTLPHIEPYVTPALHSKQSLRSLPSAVHLAQQPYGKVMHHFLPELDEGQIDQVYKVLKSLPILRVNLRAWGSWQDQSDGQPLTKNRMDVCACAEYTVSVALERLNRPTERRAYAPRFHKPKSEGWILILGDVERAELLALRRVAFAQRKTNVQLIFQTPEKLGPVNFTLYVLSDTYLGLDQQYEIQMNVIPNEIPSSTLGEIEESPSYKLF
ncbi:activating signal cointegrator 1 complex subunit [Nesidiocoris tenuis]|uniref:U5 small nuclear ribonucleoprotein 200 kDa helicase n=1 Tax=Nesidiocoris tenuis TaxID=355587 RepID=A0ABN7AQ73_9HEMI|nr:activating signal cointegrator 1 complex subunit [Nesidiocoris tenuis]